MSNFYKCIRPKYLQDFQCDGKACGSKCCGDWRITIDPETLCKYNNMEPREEGQEILSHIIYRKQYQSFGISLRKDYRCPFLDSDYLCKIQKRYGEAYIADICATYPRVFYLLGDVMEESLAVTCPLAAKRVLLSGSDIQFEEVEMPYPRKTQIIDWTKHVAAFPDCWRQIQEACIAVLQDKTSPIDNRMLRLLVLLEHLDSLEVDAIPQWLAKAKTAGFSSPGLPKFSFFPDSHIEYMAQLLAKLYGMDLADQKMFALKCVYIENLFGLFADIKEKYAIALENYAVNEFFLRLFPFAFSGSLLYNGKLFVVGYKLAELSLLLSAISHGSSLEEEDFLQMLDRIAERLDHSRDGMVHIRESLSGVPLEQSVAEFARYMLNVSKE